MKKPMKLTELNTLFEVEYGNKFDLNKMKQAPAKNSIAFIGRSGLRNGVVAYVEEFQKIEPYKAGFITVALGGAALSSFVQPRTFYTAQNIAVLKPSSAMSLETKLYYCLCIEANRFRYSTFGREANRTLRTLLVPSLESIPQWVTNAATRSIDSIKADLEESLDLF